MDNKNEGAPRYSLIIETRQNDQYYYDINNNCFVYLNNGEKEVKTTLSKIDALTTIFADKNGFAKHYGIEDDLKNIYIKYIFKGENYLAPVFNNKLWNKIAQKNNGKRVDFRDTDTLFALNSIYFDLINPESEFQYYFLRNPDRTIKVCNKTRDLIESMIAHERAIRDKQKNTGFIKDDIYVTDKTGFYMDFRNRLSSSYRDFRSLYLNHCKINNKKEEIEKKLENGTQKKVLIPPKQISMFD